MKKTTLLTLFLLFSFSLFCQEWQQKESVFFKEEGKFLFAVDSAISAQRDALVGKVKESLQKKLDFLQERDFDDFLVIAFVSNRGRLHQLTGIRASAFTMFKTSEMPGNSLLLVYDSLHCPLNRELMRVVLATKWGRLQDDRLTWLEQGLATYVSPEADNCDGYTIEEKYTYLLQRDKLIDLTVFPTNDISPEFKAARLQAAYIVSNLLEMYGITKLKQLWIEGMDDFETIFGESFSDITDRINQTIQSENVPPFPIDWETFSKDCIDPQPDDWLPVYDSIDAFEPGLLVTKEVGNLKFTVEQAMTIDMRNQAIADTKKHIADNLQLIGETGEIDSVHIYLVRNRDGMRKYFGGSIGGLYKPKGDFEYDFENSLYSVYGNKYSPFKHELMHLVNIQRWGYDTTIVPEWLVEGFAVFANPEVYSCEGYNLEELYVYFLQNNLLLDVNSLIDFPSYREIYEDKISYSQSGYLTSVLYEKYGVGKLKQLWQSGMDDFEKIYGITFAQMIEELNIKLNEKYPDPIPLDWEEFARKSCIE